MKRGPSVLDHLRDIPALRTIPQLIEGACFNTARVALLRLGQPLEVELKRPRVVMLLDEWDWVAVAPWDECLPLLSWSRFDLQTRVALHDDVSCELRLFDIRSGLIMRTALDALHVKLRERLAPDSPMEVAHGSD